MYLLLFYVGQGCLHTLSTNEYSWRVSDVTSGRNQVVVVSWAILSALEPCWSRWATLVFLCFSFSKDVKTSTGYGTMVCSWHLVQERPRLVVVFGFVGRRWRRKTGLVNVVVFQLCFDFIDAAMGGDSCFCRGDKTTIISYVYTCISLTAGVVYSCLIVVVGVVFWLADSMGL